MTIKLEIVAQDQAELTTKLLALGEALRMGGNVQKGVEQVNVKSSAKVEEVAAEEKDEAPAKPAGKKGAAAKPKTEPKKAKGPSEDTLREYVGTLAAYLLNDADEAPKLADFLEERKLEDLESIDADDLPEFAADLFELVESIFDGVPAVPAK